MLFHFFFVNLPRFCDIIETDYSKRLMKDINLDEIFEENPRDGSISFIAKIDSSDIQNLSYEISVEKVIPILPLRGTMLFPMTLIPIRVGRNTSYKLLNEANKKDMPIAVFSQTADHIDDPTINEIYHTGVIAKVVRLIKLPDNSYTAFLQGYTRVRLVEFYKGAKWYEGHVEAIPEVLGMKNDRQFKAIAEACREIADKICQAQANGMMGTSMGINNIPDMNLLINFICANLPIDNSERILLLEQNTMEDRALKLMNVLNREYQFAKLKDSIQNRTREELSKQQREHYLRMEMDSIKEQLGENAANDEERLKKAAEMKNWGEKIDEMFWKEFRKLGTMPQGGPDYQITLNYLQTLVDLPWNENTKDNLNLNNAEKVLNKDHYGMEKVKERILEHLAVLKMRGDFKSPIICLYGPPGVGKTSLGKSIAKSMKRNYVRMSLGGVHDEAEIRGHRKTYVGAMPGQIIKNMLKAKSSNPVFILDEIDKVANDNIHGDPASALLEVLDPEQNVAFHDNFLDCDYDLSKVMFIATANNISTIPAPLLDRMELIEVSGYLTEEKIEIAKRHLIPNELDNLGMKDSKIKFSKNAIEKIIESYTRESGVRNLDKQINSLLRKITLEYAKTETLPDHEIKPEDVVKYLGTEPFTRDIYQGNEYYGVVTGLAWTSVGGEILFIETSINESKGGKLTLTGNLGDVMKESAMIALEYLKSHPEVLGELDWKKPAKEGEKEEPTTWADFFDYHSIHMHVPEGATPKDGPSAGITIATSIASAITKRKVRKNLAMTGEITLRGKVLPVGGIKEKILAAKRAGITDILICEDNKKNILDIPEKYVKGVTFHYIKDVKDVLKFALV